ncbi:hypothetical protein FRB90_009676, partial [Tulasnella sp. 427]
MAAQPRIPLNNDGDDVQSATFTKSEDKEPFNRNRAEDSKTSVFLQEKCYLHRYIRSKDLSGVVERPERLRAVALGFAAAIAQFEEEEPTTGNGQSNSQDTPSLTSDASEQLARAMSQLGIGTPPGSESGSGLCRIIASEATCNLQTHPGVSFIHANEDIKLVGGRDYLSRLRDWAEQSEAKISGGESELPKHLPLGDLY